MALTLGAARYLTDTSSNICAKFRQDGYVVIEGGIEGDLIDRVRMRIEEELAFIPENERPSLPGFSFETGRYQDAWRLIPEVAEVAGSSSVMTALRELYGFEAHPFQTLNFTVGTQQKAHSDHIHFSSRPLGFMCGAWVAIEDVTEENGPLFYYPGSHNLPYMSYFELGFDPSSFDSEPEAYLQYEVVIEQLMETHGFERKVFTAKKGDVLIWAANLVHGGSPVKKADSTRWSQVTHYLFDDCVHYTPRLSNELVGDLYVRQPIDVRTAEPIRSAYPSIETPSETPAQENPIPPVPQVGQPSADLLAEIERLSRRVHRLRAELDAIRNTKLFRYTRIPRTWYSGLRRRVKRA